MCVLTTLADIQLGRLGPLLEQCRPEWETFRLMRIHTYIRHDTLLCLCPIASSLFSLVIIHSYARRLKLGLSQSVSQDRPTTFSAAGQTRGERGGLACRSPSSLHPDSSCLALHNTLPKLSSPRLWRSARQKHLLMTPNGQTVLKGTWHKIRTDAELKCIIVERCPMRTEQVLGFQELQRLLHL